MNNKLVVSVFRVRKKFRSLAFPPLTVSQATLSPREKERERERACRHVVTILHYDTSPFTPGSFSSSHLFASPATPLPRGIAVEGSRRAQDGRRSSRTRSKVGPSATPKRQKGKRDSRLLFFFFFFISSGTKGWEKRTSSFFVAERC